MENKNDYSKFTVNEFVETEDARKAYYQKLKETRYLVIVPSALFLTGLIMMIYALS